MAKREYTPYQQKVIRRYYQNFDAIQYQRLSELVTELYLAEGEKKQETLWKRAAAILQKSGLPASRLDHLLERRDPALLANLLKEWESDSKK